VANAYDLVRYPNIPLSRTHPAALGVFAALFGRPFAPFAACRVLEIGCGEGVNLLNMALGAPASEFVGVDLAEQPIALARKAALAMGLANARFHVQDIVEMGGELGSFDYIIAHGVYAWVPPSVREALMRVAGALLRPEGVAFISYNAFPGAAIRQVLRDLLLGATQQIDDPSEKLRIARAVLAYQIENGAQAEPLQQAMVAAARKMLERPPEVLFHDELTECFAPQWLSDVVAAARAAGLDYLCDAQPALSAEALFPTQKFAAARAFTDGDWARFEQIEDFSVMRAFRHSIFCRGGPIDRRLEARRLRGLWASGQLQAVEAKSEAADAFAFRAGASANITTNDANLARFLARVGAAFPSALALDEAADDPDLAVQILRLFVAKVLRLSAAAFSFTLTPGDRPMVSPLARFQAERGEKTLASLRHGSIEIEDSATRLFVALLDGTRTRDDLARELAARTGVTPQAALTQVSAALEQMARLGLMMG
jgi:SAM-dependent methyltransferase